MLSFVLFVEIFVLGMCIRAVEHVLLFLTNIKYMLPDTLLVSGTLHICEILKPKYLQMYHRIGSGR